MPAQPGGRPGFVDGVGAFLHTPSRGRAVPVVLDALTMRDARLRVHNEVELRLPVAARITLELVHERGINVSLPARLVELRKGDVTRALTVDFVSDQGASALLDPRIAHLFDKRGSFRVKPSESAPIELTVMPSGEGAELMEAAEVLDISSDGIGLLVSRRFERSTAHTTRLACLLKLPGAATTHPITGTIRHRTVVGPSHVRYGLRWELTESPADRRVYEDLLAYVVTRLGDLG